MTFAVLRTLLTNHLEYQPVAFPPAERTKAKVWMHAHAVVFRCLGSNLDVLIGLDCINEPLQRQVEFCIILRPCQLSNQRSSKTH